MNTKTRILKVFTSSLLTASLLVLTLLPAMAVTTYTDIPVDAAWKSDVELLTRIGVLQGMTEGQFQPDAEVTREQFAKMAVTLTTLATTDNTRQNATRFLDVPASRWSSGYIRTAAANGLLTGYADGRFYPDTTISYAQVLTVCLRLLGHDDSTLGGAWPDNVVSKATALGLTKGLSLSPGDKMTRRDCAILLARLLQTDKNDMPYAESAGLFQTLVILADDTVDSSLSKDEIRTTAGILVNASGEALTIGQEVRVKSEDNHIVQTYGSTGNSHTYPVTALTDSALYYRIGFATMTLTLTADMTFYDNTGVLSYESLFSSALAGGSVTLAYDSKRTELRHLHFSRPAAARAGTYTDLLILDTAQTKETLPENQVITDKGTFTLATGIDVPEPGIRIGAVVNGTVLTATQGQLNKTARATVLQTVGTQVVQQKNGIMETVALPLTTTWYHDGQVVPADVLPSLLTRCSSIVYGLQPASAAVAYAVLYDPIYSSPQFADQQEVYDMTLGDIDLHDMLLSRAGAIIAVYEISNNDVAYAVTDIWGGHQYVELYQGQYIGVIESYAPNRFSPTSLSLSVYNDQTGRYASQTFAFSPEFPVSALSDMKYDIGDSVILLTGRDGKIVKLYP